MSNKHLKLKSINAMSQVYSKFILILYALSICTCIHPKIKSDPVVSPTNILKDFMSYWSYNHKFVNLNNDFIAIDEKNNIISKEQFLLSIINYSFLPLRNISNDSQIIYQLYPLGRLTDDSVDIIKTIKSMALIDYKHYMNEGKMFPEFNFFDLTNTNYNTTNSKNKIGSLPYLVGIKI